MFDTTTTWKVRTKRQAASAIAGTWGLMGLQGSLSGLPGAVAVGVGASVGILANYWQHGGGR